MYFILVILFGFTIFLFQIFNNFIIFIMIIINNNLSDFFINLDSDFRKIKNFDFFNNYGGVVLQNIYKYIAIILSLFFGSPFWILNFMIINYRIETNKQITKETFLFFYIFTIFLISLAIYPISFLLNIIGIFYIRYILGHNSSAKYIEKVIKFQENF